MGFSGFWGRVWVCPGMGFLGPSFTLGGADGDIVDFGSIHRFSPISYGRYPRVPEELEVKRPRKSMNKNQERNSSKSELTTLKNTKVRAISVLQQVGKKMISLFKWNTPDMKYPMQPKNSGINISC